MRKILAGLLAILLLSAVGCAGTVRESASPSASGGTYQKITPEEAKKMMDNGDAIVLVDVRSEGEFNGAHLNDAINIPVETITLGKPEALPDQNTTIIVYCQTGNRSETAAKLLLKLGYQTVYDLGGIVDWPYDTVASPAAPSTDNTSAGILGSFKAKDIAGNDVDQSIFKNHKLTMVNVWATFCSPCINEMPELGKLNRDMAQSGIQVIGIVSDASDRDLKPIDDMVATANDIIKMTGADYVHLLPSADLVSALLSQVTAVPTTIFVDENGKQVGETYVGSYSGDEWADIIDKLLKEVK